MKANPRCSGIVLGAVHLIAGIWASQSLLANTFEVGPGLTYTNLGSVPWMSLNPGDTVNIHYKPGGYHEIILRLAPWRLCVNHPF